MTRDTQPTFERCDGARRRRSLAGLSAIILAMSGCDTSNLLKVELPGQVIEADLDDASLAGTLTASVVADVGCAWASYVSAASFHSDEWIYAGTGGDSRRWGLRDIGDGFLTYAQAGCGAGDFGVYTPLHIGRVQAQQQAARIVAFDDAIVANKTALLATIEAYGGYTLIAFAEGFCGTPLDGGSEILTSDELFQLAEDGFSKALQWASDAGLDDARNLALVGRARARLGLEDYQGAVEDAELVPVGFRLDVARDNAAVRNYNTIYSRLNGPPDGDFGQRLGAVAPSFRALEWKGVPDDRVSVSWDGATLASDIATPHWKVDDKHLSFSESMMLASYEEAQMFIAEAAAVTGDLPRARAILNAFHDAAGLPAVTEADIPTQEDVIRHIIQERAREFFVEGGHRLRDHLRWRGTEFELPFLGEPGSDHPDGIDETGQRYENTTCFPVPANDRSS